MLRAFSLKSPLPWALLLGACFAASCDDRGATSVCPPLPLYRNSQLDASPPDASSADGGEAQAALAAAVDAGCATAPTQFPYDGSAAGASGAANENGGSSGKGGGAGAPLGGGAGAVSIGGSAGETAGAAGGG